MPTQRDPGAGRQGLTHTNLDQLLTLHPEVAGVFARHGMLCVGCPIARFHTLQDAAALYALDLAAIAREIEQRLQPAQTTRGSGNSQD